MDLDLVKHYKQRNAEGKMTDWYKIEGDDRPDLPYQIILYVILDNYRGQIAKRDFSMEDVNFQVYLK